VEYRNLKNHSFSSFTSCSAKFTAQLAWRLEDKGCLRYTLPATACVVFGSHLVLKLCAWLVDWNVAVRTDEMCYYITNWWCFRAKKIPIIIRRYLPDGSYEDWSVDELIITDIWQSLMMSSILYSFIDYTFVVSHSLQVLIIVFFTEIIVKKLVFNRPYQRSRCWYCVASVWIVQKCCVCRLSVTWCIVAKRCVLEQQLLLRAYSKLHMRNRLVPKWMILMFVYDTIRYDRRV